MGLADDLRHILLTYASVKVGYAVSTPYEQND